MSFDPYREWLEIESGGAAPDHYQLLGLPPFCAEPEAIRTAFEARYACVRTYQVGRYSERAVALLQELSQAFRCLTEASLKATYDRQLRDHITPRKISDGTNSPDGMWETLPELWLQNATTQTEPGSAAENGEFDPGLVHLAAVELRRLLPERFVREHCVVPFHEADGVVQVATTNANDLELLQKCEFLLGKRVALLAAPADALAAAIKRLFGEAGSERHDQSSRESVVSSAPDPRIDLLNSKALVTCLNEQIARTYGVIPVALDGEELSIAIAERSRGDREEVIALLTMILKRPIQARDVSVQEMKETLDRCYPPELASSGQTASEEIDYSALLEPGLTEEVDRFMHLVVAIAVTEHAKEILIRPTPTGMQLFIYPTDSTCPHEVVPPPDALRADLLQYLKQNIWRDGNIRFKIGNRAYRLRVAVCPTPHGDATTLSFPDPKDSGEDQPARQPEARDSTPGALRFCPHCGRQVSSKSLCTACATEPPPSSVAVAAWLKAKCDRCGKRLKHRGVVICDDCGCDHALSTPRIRPRLTPAYSLPFAARQWPVADE